MPTDISAPGGGAILRVHRVMCCDGKPIPGSIGRITIEKVPKISGLQATGTIVRCRVLQKSLDAELYRPKPSMVTGSKDLGVLQTKSPRGSQRELARLVVTIDRRVANKAQAMLLVKRLAEVLSFVKKQTRLALPDRLRGQVVLFTERDEDLMAWHSMHETSGNDQASMTWQRVPGRTWRHGNNVS